MKRLKHLLDKKHLLYAGFYRSHIRNTLSISVITIFVIQIRKSVLYFMNSSIKYLIKNRDTKNFEINLSNIYCVNKIYRNSDFARLQIKFIS